MTDRWRDRLARVDRAVDRVMSEAVRITPMRVGDFSGAVPDTDRPAFETDGVLTIDRGETDMGGNAARLRNVQLPTARAELQIIKTRIPAGSNLRKDDRVEALDQGLTFKVERVDRQHPGRLVLMLSIDSSGDAA